jgi:hypothetical protein
MVIGHAMLMSGVENIGFDFWGTQIVNVGLFICFLAKYTKMRALE